MSVSVSVSSRGARRLSVPSGIPGTAPRHAGESRHPFRQFARLDSGYRPDDGACLTSGQSYGLPGQSYGLPGQRYGLPGQRAGLPGQRAGLPGQHAGLGGNAPNDVAMLS